MDADPRAQAGYGLRFDWGLAGARALAHPHALVVVVDVLSFSTTVAIAVARGTAVHPCTDDDSAADLAHRTGATLAVPRRQATPERPWSLSPALALRAPAVPRLVLPSRNGSAIAAAAGRAEAMRAVAPSGAHATPATGATPAAGATPAIGTTPATGATPADGATAPAVVTAALRNARAVAEWASARGYGTPDRPVNVVAAGERWPDGTLRPALEDLLGAAAVLRALEVEPGRPSPEARAAAAALDGVGDLDAALNGCASGRELAAIGWQDDLAAAADVDADTVVPLLSGGAFRDAAAAP
ncbi:2-phosphosulfolactate phosphatase [Georgenia muralis]